MNDGQNAGFSNDALVVLLQPDGMACFSTKDWTPRPLPATREDKILPACDTTVRAILRGQSRALPDIRPLRKGQAKVYRQGNLFCIVSESHFAVYRKIGGTTVYL